MFLFATSSGGNPIVASKEEHNIVDLTSLNYNCDKVESKEGGFRRDGVENKDLLDRDGEREGVGEGEREARLGPETPKIKMGS